MTRVGKRLALAGPHEMVAFTGSGGDRYSFPP